MDTPEFDNLLKTYKGAVDEWISAIRKEESLATGDHRLIPMEQWDHAIQTVQDREDQVKKARCDYQDALRQNNYGF